jgi:hypothetical protein
MTMQLFTGYEYLLIDCANHYGLDKELFSDRIQWVKDHFDHLEDLMDEADEPILYIKAVNTIRAAHRGEASGYMVAFDACSSGMQIMGALMNCEKTCDLTGLIDPDRRADAYTDGTQYMAKLLGNSVDVSRKDTKAAMMTHFYGSKAKPIELFGEGTDELQAFYTMLWELAPGASELMEILLSTWNRDALQHEWSMPDGFHARCKVTYPVDIRIEVDELDHASFTHRFYENISTNAYEAKTGEEQRDGLSNAANVVHSIDGMLVREMNRRCNYDPEQVHKALARIDELLNEKEDNGKPNTTFVTVRYAEDWFDRLDQCAPSYLKKLKEILLTMLDYKPFPIICVHDCFKCHPNYMNHVRYWYKEMLAELAESDLLDYILTQLFNKPVRLQKYGDIAHKIRNSNYALS